MASHPRPSGRRVLSGSISGASAFRCEPGIEHVSLPTARPAFCGRLVPDHERRSRRVEAGIFQVLIARRGAGKAVIAPEVPHKAWWIFRVAHRGGGRSPTKKNFASGFGRNPGGALAQQSRPRSRKEDERRGLRHQSFGQSRRRAPCFGTRQGHSGRTRKNGLD